MQNIRVHKTLKPKLPGTRRLHIRADVGKRVINTIVDCSEALPMSVVFQHAQKDLEAQCK